MDRIKEKLSLLPQSPGCYLMKNSDGNIIYVGKAKKLKNRVSSYFRGTHTGKTAKMVSEIADFEYITVHSEMESLILEANLIKQYNPKYNILMKDDKSYPYIELTNEKVPRLKVVRSLSRKRNQKYLYGPYPNVTAARSVVNLLNRIYPVRKCNTYEKKPCLYYYIGQCLGYCTNQVDISKIEEMRHDIIRFLNGDHSLVTQKLKEQMDMYSTNMEYEKALELKQLLDYINITLAHQQVEISDLLARDIFGIYVDRGYLSIQVFFIRGAKIVERHSKIMPLLDDIENQFMRYIADFYNHNLKPKEILIPDIDVADVLGKYLDVSVKIPQKGDKHKLVLLANQNAKIALDEQFDLIQKDESKTSDANEELRQLLGLEHLDRIEIFDNSNLFGSFNVSGMVVFINGKPSKNDYRKFKITNDKNDDYGTMREVIYRRYFRVLKDNLVRPDLIIVDGGIGQIRIAKEVIDSLGLSILVAGLKKDDHHATNQLLTIDKVYDIDKRSNLFYLLERMQDEVHNFTISYHKKIRSKGSLASILDNVDGIGKKRKEALLKKYHTITKMKTASDEELSKIIPLNVAHNLLDYLNSID